MPNISRSKILRTKEAFKIKSKAYFVHFKGLSVAKNCPKLESEPLKVSTIFIRSLVFLRK